MEYDFDKNDFVEETQDQKEEKLYNETYKKQLKLTKIALISTFGGLTVLFLFLAILFNFVFDKTIEDNLEAIYVMNAMTITFGIITLIILLIKFKVPDYKKFKEYSKKWGGYSSFNMLTRIEMLEKRVEELEKRNK